MYLGIVVPTKDDVASSALADAAGEMAAALRSLGHEVVISSFGGAGNSWALPVSAAAEPALALARSLRRCEAVIDLAEGWLEVARRSGFDRPVLDAARLDQPLGIDVTAFAAGAGTGEFVLSEATVGMVLPADASRPERAALLGDAAVFVAGPGWGGAALALEALACGTPVVATADTPAAALVEDGLTGAVTEPAGVADALDRARAVDRWWCRKRALDRLSPESAARRLVSQLAPVGRRRRPDFDVTGNGSRELVAAAG